MPPKRAPGSAAGGRKKANAGAAFEMAEPFTNGTILTDLYHKTWTISNPIGQGGFGCLYECRSTSVKTSSYVVKVEPDSNGPLFCEMHFYLQLGKKTLQETFLKVNHLDHLGVPQLVTHGMHQSSTSKRRYRFLVIPRYKQTLADELRSSSNRKLDEKRVQSIGKELLHIYEYIHSHGYVHADVKAENIMMNDNVHVYLLDYGLSRKASPQYEEKVQRRHEGTLEFTSLDVHRGASPSFRGDLEILFYNLLTWLGAQLPWINITDPVRVQQGKQTAQSDPSGFVQNLFNDKNKISSKMLDAIVQFYREIISMNYTEQGDYRRLREILGGQTRQRRSSIGAVSSRRPLIEMANDDDDDDDDDTERKKNKIEVVEDDKTNLPPKRTSPRRSAKNLNTTTTRPRSESRERHRRSSPVQMLSERKRPRTKSKYRQTKKKRS